MKKKLKIETRGRRPISPELKKKYKNFTVDPRVDEKLNLITKCSQSRFISEILGAVPKAWISSYNEDPEKFLDKIRNREICLKPA